MLALLAVTFCLTIAGANVPSQLLGNLLFRGEEQLAVAFAAIHAPIWVTGLLVHGAYRVLAAILPTLAVAPSPTGSGLC